MSIRPVDMQIVVPKTLEYANKHQGEIQKQVSDQQMYSQVAAKNTEQKQTMVIQTNESKNMNNSVNEDGHNKQEYKGNKKRKNEDENEENKKGSTSTGLFDVKI